MSASSRISNPQNVSCLKELYYHYVICMGRFQVHVRATSELFLVENRVIFRVISASGSPATVQWHSVTLYLG
jgi:hypothetical protein